MDEEKKNEMLSEIDGLEEWMNQFVIDPFFDGNIDGFRMDLFETESSYIIEAMIPKFNREDLKIQVKKDGIHLYLYKKGKEYHRFIELPFSLCKKLITATFKHHVLEIKINKKGKRRKTVRTIKIT